MPRARAAAAGSLPWRGPEAEGADNPRPEVPLPPGNLPLLGPGRRLRKRWRYIGVFADEFMLCAARVRVGPFGQTFWAVLDRESGELIERTRKLLPLQRGEVWSEVGDDGEEWLIGSSRGDVQTRVDGPGLEARLRVGVGEWAECVCDNGEGSGGYVWTRKRVAPVDCDLRLADGRRFGGEAFSLEDESAGYHPRHTVWYWSAGVGQAADGRAVGWNLVAGVNDPPSGSERAIWIDGKPYEPGPVEFEALDAIEFEGGARLGFEAEAERKNNEGVLGIKSIYRQPFGRFSGSLDGIELDSAIGVMEHHEAWW